MRTSGSLKAAHSPNVTALTGISPAQGEMVILTPSGDGNFRIAGRLRAAAAARM
jgi:hypothetical protein